MGSSLAFLVQFIQSMELLSSFVFFNVKYSIVISNLLTILYNAFQADFIDNPLHKLISKSSDFAWVYHYKLSQVQLPPFLLDDAGIEIYPIIIVNIIS